MESEIQEILLSQFAEDDLNEIIEYHFSMSQNYVEKQWILQYRELIQGYYRIIYEIDDNKIIVHSIVDGRRNFEETIISKLSRYYGNKIW